MSDDYAVFLQEKRVLDEPSGFAPTPLLGERGLFAFQETIVRWACRRGRAAVFADTGLGKTRMQVAWAEQVLRHAGSVLIFAPLCVASQTVAEAERMGVLVEYVREAPTTEGIFITNYELFNHFEEAILAGRFRGVVLDESSILKHETSKTRNNLIRATRSVPYRLSCTATPSPNDYMELGNQAEFLGVMSMTEMLAMFFIHDSGHTSQWRLKGHGRAVFWEWMSQWAVCIRKPADLGFSDEGYDLPPLVINEEVVGSSGVVAQTMSDRNTARRESIGDRVLACAERVNSTPGQWIVWCHLNEESAQLAAAIPGAVEVRGSDSLVVKEERLLAFTNGTARVLVTKPSIAGFGMNWQHCHQMAFVGLNDSYEQLYQGVRRCYRFGQTHPVTVVLFSAASEGAVLENIKRKEAQNTEMSVMMVEHMRSFSQRSISRLSREQSVYERVVEQGDGWALHLGDCVDVTRELPEQSVDYSVFSPPFSSLYTYSNSDRDMGNSKSDQEFWEHFRFLIKELYRVLRNGRNVSVHCMNLPASKQREGYIGIKDFRGDIIREFQRMGFIYHSEVCIWKDPVVAMQRTKALGLLWKQLKKDSAMSRQGIPDYVVTFRKPGANTKPITHDAGEFPVSEWQQLASPCWNDIKQSNTLNRQGAKEQDDERHIAPLQLDVIQRCIRLWSSPGDVVFSPFAGIGSEGYVARKMRRAFLGIELKQSYFEIAKRNLTNAMADASWERTPQATREPILPKKQERVVQRVVQDFFSGDSLEDEEVASCQ